MHARSISSMRVFGDIIQPTHLIFILVVALIVLGPKRLPEVGRSLGRGLRDFRQGMQGVEAEARGVFRDVTDDQPEQPATAAMSPAGSESVSEMGDRIGLAAPSVASVPASAPGTTPVATPIAKEPDPSDYSD
jgi:sec-independent protein translocase protein TatA